MNSPSRAWFRDGVITLTDRRLRELRVTKTGGRLHAVSRIRTVQSFVSQPLNCVTEGQYSTMDAGEMMSTNFCISRKRASFMDTVMLTQRQGQRELSTTSRAASNATASIVTIIVHREENKEQRKQLIRALIGNQRSQSDKAKTGQTQSKMFPSRGTAPQRASIICRDPGLSCLTY